MVWNNLAGQFVCNVQGWSFYHVRKRQDGQTNKTQYIDPYDTHMDQKPQQENNY